MKTTPRAKPSPDAFGITESDLGFVREQESKNCAYSYSPSPAILTLIVVAAFALSSQLPSSIISAWGSSGDRAFGIFWYGLLIGAAIYIVLTMAVENTIRLSSRARLNSFSKLTEVIAYREALYAYERDVRKDEREAQIARARDEQLARQREREEKRRTYEYWMEIDPYEFEREIAKVFERCGYAAKVTKGSDDGGVDIVLSKGQRRGAVQCKRHGKKVGPAVIRELYGAMAHNKYSFGYVVCPSGFTDRAYEFSKNKNIKLVGLKRIVDMVTDSQNQEA